MLRFLKTVLAIIGTLALVLVAVVVGSVWYFTRDRGTDLASEFAVVIDLAQPIRESGEPDQLAALFGPAEPDLADLLEAIDRASLDDRVTGIVVRFQGDSLSLPAAQDMAAALDRFTATGRPAVGQAESIGMLGQANGAYLVASATRPLAVDAFGTVGLTGFNMEIPFAAEALSRLGIEAQVVRRGDYKTAFDSLTEDGLTPAHREMMTALADDLFAQLTDDVAGRRSLTPLQVRQAINRAPLRADEALDAGLIDLVQDSGPRDEQARHLLEAAEALPLVPVATYLSDDLPVPLEGESTPPTIALIEAAGVIVDDGGGAPSGTDSSEITPAPLLRQLRQAAEDDGIDAVLIALDSGGGSAAASDRIGRAIERLREETGKPVAVSMGRVAASGGYWIAASADRIIAHPATLTGSIGVIAIRPNLAGAMDHLGITWEAIQRGTNADLWSPFQPLSSRQEAHLEALIEDMYQRFLTQVANGRDIPVEAVDQLGQGRVWTGHQALELGLVDAVGGWHTAIGELREMLDLPVEGGAILRPMTEQGSRLEQALNLVGDLPFGLQSLSQSPSLHQLLPDALPGREMTTPFLWALTDSLDGISQPLAILPPMRLDGH